MLVCIISASCLHKSALIFSADPQQDPGAKGVKGVKDRYKNAGVKAV
jgi:hypothetical protein